MDLTSQDNSAIFRTVPLRPETVRRAYPLVHLFDRALDLTEWTTYAKSLIRQNARTGGLKAIEDGRGYIHAVFAYSVRRHLRHRKLLRVSDVVIGHLPGQILAQTLLDSIAELACECDCERVMVELGDGSAAREAMWQAGFTPTDIECFLNERTGQEAGVSAAE